MSSSFTYPLQIGITGGIGSGKSLVCRIFNCLGIPVYDADTQAKELMNTDPVLVEQLKKEFGDEAYLKDGSIDRKYIASKVFGNEEKLKVLNGLVHPRVKVDYAKWKEENLQAPYVIREAALIFEAGVWQDLDKVIVVSAPEELRMQRVLTRDPHRNRKDVEQIFRNQMPEDEKLKRADHVIYNDDTRMVLPQVLSLHEKFVGKI